MELLGHLRKAGAMPVIFLTSKDDEVDEVLGLRMGADDYIKKPFSQRLLVERIRALLRRGEIARRRRGLRRRGRRPARRADARSRPPPMQLEGPGRRSHRDRIPDPEIAGARPGHVKSRDQLMDGAYGEHIYVDDRTIDSHIKRLRKKFKAVDDRFRSDRNPLWRRIPLQRDLTREAANPLPP